MSSAISKPWQALWFLLCCSLWGRSRLEGSSPDKPTPCHGAHKDAGTTQL